MYSWLVSYWKVSADFRWTEQMPKVPKNVFLHSRTSQSHGRVLRNCPTKGDDTGAEVGSSLQASRCAPQDDATPSASAKPRKAAPVEQLQKSREASGVPASKCQKMSEVSVIFGSESEHAEKVARARQVTSPLLRPLPIFRPHLLGQLKPAQAALRPDRRDCPSFSSRCTTT